MIGGNALGDNSKKNETDKKQEESFHEKYRRELKKDFDDLVADDEEDENEANTNETSSVSGESEDDVP